MRTTHTIIIGAGQAGLAASHCHTERGHDHVVLERGLASEVFDPEPISTVAMHHEVDAIDLRATGIRTVIWATGQRRSYPWLRIPVLDRSGELRQRRGVTPAPGLYVLGQRFQHYRSSNFIGRVGRDAAYVADHMVAHRPSRLTSNENC